jgi:hypothetical protein
MWFRSLLLLPYKSGRDLLKEKGTEHRRHHGQCGSASHGGSALFHENIHTELPLASGPAMRHFSPIDHWLLRLDSRLLIWLHDLDERAQ